MGTSTSALHHRCTYNCVHAGHSTCASNDERDCWAAEEFQKAMSALDMVKIRELVSCTQALKDQEIAFPGEQHKMTALAYALNRRDARIVRELLDAGVSPNLPISAQQRSIYAHRAHLAALNGGDADLQNLTPSTHFEALCCVQHKELFNVLLEKGATAHVGLIQTSHCGDAEMLKALLVRSADPNTWRNSSTPLVTSVKSKLQSYEKVVLLLHASADPNFPPFPTTTTVLTTGGIVRGGSAVATGYEVPAVPPRHFYPALTLATRKRDYRMVRMLLEAGADVNRSVGEEGLPNVMFWATYWGELELMKLFVTLSKHKLDLTVRKYTNETIFDVAMTSKNFASSKKPRHIAKLPLPNRPAMVYDKIAQLLEDYRIQHLDVASGSVVSASLVPLAANATASTTATGQTSLDRSLACDAPAPPAVPATSLATAKPS